MKVLGNLESITALSPELVLTGFIAIVILADLSGWFSRRAMALIVAFGLAAAAAFTAKVFCAVVAGEPSLIFLGMAANDIYGLLFKFLFLVAAFVVALFSIPVVERWKGGIGEYYALLLSCTLGMCLMASANDLLMMYLALEFVSISSFIMAGMLRRHRKSSEAALKYIIYGAAASGIMLFGMSYLYGMTGETGVAAVGHALSGTHPGTPFMAMVSLFVMAGFGYKIASVPFHLWCPDVYEGSPTPVTAFFSVGPKAAGFAMLIRFVTGVFGGGTDLFEWGVALSILSVLTMAVGNFSALHQSNLKRLMAYSSIAHAGYILLALTYCTPENIATVAFYLIVYLFMNLGAFLVIVIIEEKFGIETVEECRGLGWRAPVLCSLMAIFLFSLTGLPPTAGFIGKLLLFGFVLKEGALGTALVVVAVLFSAISLYYYARVIGAMFLRREETVGAPPVVVGLGSSMLLWALALPTLILGLFWGPLYEFVLAAVAVIAR